MPDVAGPSPDAVKTWISEIDERIRDVQNRIEPLLVEQGQLRERRKLLGELLSSFGQEPPDAVAGADSQVVVHSTQAAATASKGRETVRERVHREVVTVLQELGRPVHVNDLLAEYVKRGYKVPGQGKAANISVHLSGWSDIENPERGIYGLVNGTPDSEGDG